MKIDPVNALVKQRVGIRCSGDFRSPAGGRRPPLQAGARRAESSTRAQTMAARQTRNGLRRHPDLPRVWVSNPIEFLSTEEVWAYLLQNPHRRGNPPRTDTPWRVPTTESPPPRQSPPYGHAMACPYASASNGECPIQIGTSTPSCGHSRFGCWTCTVVDRDKVSEGLLAAPFLAGLVLDKPMRSDLCLF